MVHWLPLKRLLALFSPKYADSVALARCTALRKKGAYREAYALLWDIMNRHPDWRLGDAYVQCANLELLVNDDASKASELLDTGLRLGCDNMAVYYCMSGYVLLRLGEHERGIREMERAVDLEPSVYYLSMLGAELSFRGDHRAADIWKRVLKQEPLNCRAYANLGILAIKTGDREKALLLARRAEELHLDPGDLLDIARSYAAMGEYQIALHRYAQAEGLGQELLASTCAEIASCHFELGDSVEGRRRLEEGRRKFPKSKCIQDAWETYGRRCDEGHEGGRGEPR
jgi:tetratricopeptide (TPR) repeat protein